MKTPNTNNIINLEQEAELTLNLGQGMEHFVIAGDAEAVMPLAEAAQAYDAAHPVQKARETAVQPAVAVQTTKPAYEDFNTLEAKEVLRRKISAWVYDRKNGTSMLDLLNQRIADDRNVAMAQRLGLISSVHCAKHERVIAQLKRIV